MRSKTVLFALGLIKNWGLFCKESLWSELNPCNEAIIGWAQLSVAISAPLGQSG